MAYAYQDDLGVLRIVETEKAAEFYACGRIVATYIPHAGGYPQVEGECGMSPLIICEDGSAYVGYDIHSGHKVSLSNYPAVERLFESLKS
ncbi:hypothetical protein JQN58_04940 [Aneurinibacillus sp. BA2021]|nr:hypothetical protein [Aneurinibacillus sp. BA2021]